MSPPRLILASASPRRRDLLESVGIGFEVDPVDIDEAVRPGEKPHDYVHRLAIEKAVAGRGRHPGEFVLAADTIVVLDGEILGKPRDVEDARATLRRLAGRSHTVYTGVALCYRDPVGREQVASEVELSDVRIAEMTDEEIAWYVETGEPMDKAGSYGIQGIGAIFVERVEGSYSNVVGLPLATTYRLFAAHGHDLRDLRRGVSRDRAARG